MQDQVDEALVAPDNLQSAFAANELDHDLFDFEAASNSVEAPNDLSDNEDGLYDESISQTPQLADEEDLSDDDDDDDDDGSTRTGGNFSWRIDHTTGDYKLMGIPPCNYTKCSYTANVG